MDSLPGNDPICPFYHVFANPLGHFLRILAQTLLNTVDFRVTSKYLPCSCAPSVFAICWLQVIFCKENGLGAYDST